MDVMFPQGGTVVGIQSRPPHTGSASVITNGPNQLLEIAPASTQPVLAQTALAAAPGGLLADANFA